ncbi:DUF2785 domain-containing protein [Intrasporangium sp. YIM S08009]|uniref:DUF2785 domain-containing protein n=1 Tax=Intrasporangium zincisolvens TaxID=3080018 RepID=UPI002B056DE5|nr:DUF2785 domain-containing protein [Intrasporangium sp. YIM S08009]
MPDAALTSLVDDLGSPDPAVRDDGAFSALARLVRDGTLGVEDRAWLAGAMLERLHHPRVEARAFAPLVLAALVAGGSGDPAWVPAVTRWWVGERDLRGHDPELGWVHAVAHGADFYGACGAVGLGDPDELLDALAARLVEPTDAVWHDQEEDRVAYAVALVLTHPALDPGGAVAWLDRVRALFDSGEPGPVPPHASNTMRALRSLHVALGEQVLHDGRPVVVRHADTVRDAVADVLGVVTPWFWRPARTG